MTTLVQFSVTASESLELRTPTNSSANTSLREGTEADHVRGHDGGHLALSVSWVGIGVSAARVDGHLSNPTFFSSALKRESVRSGFIIGSTFSHEMKKLRSSYALSRSVKAWSVSPNAA